MWQKSSKKHPRKVKLPDSLLPEHLSTAAPKIKIQILLL